MLESLNYSFRNPKKHNLSNLAQQTVEKLQKNHGVLRGPQLGKQRWRLRLGILRVKTGHFLNETNLGNFVIPLRPSYRVSETCKLFYGFLECKKRDSNILLHGYTEEWKSASLKLNSKWTFLIHRLQVLVFTRLGFISNTKMGLRLRSVQYRNTIMVLAS